MSLFANDPYFYPFLSKRKVVYARNGMVATSQPLASQAGLKVLQQGGNAIDAAVATAASLTVVEPTSNGIGGDAFALVWTKGKLYGLSANGPAPHSISIEKVKELGHRKMPKHGLIPVTVPGAPAAWAALAERFGALPLTKTLAPAIDYAENGHPVSPTVATNWAKALGEYGQYRETAAFRPWFETFTRGGKTPLSGEMWFCPDQAKTLRSIAVSNAASFYRGELAEAIDCFSRAHGGFLRASDLAAYQPEWVDPIGINYRGYDIWEIPPSGQGLVALMALNIMSGFEPAYLNDLDTMHRQIEAIKLAFADGFEYITDPSHMVCTVEELLSDDYAQQRRALIGSQATLPQAGDPRGGGTVYLATADGEGNMVSYIQSNYKGFGSGIVVPGTGIALQNRGWQFSLDPADHNSLSPGKKTYHTIIPGFITHGDQPVGPFGVMGGYMQPQGHLQVTMNVIDFALNPQAALDAPRWQWMEGRVVQVEPHFPSYLAQALARRGHAIVPALDSNGFGRGQMIVRHPESGVLVGGTDPRTDGQIASW